MHFLISCVYCWYYEGYINYALLNYHVIETVRRPPVGSDGRKRFESSKCLYHSSTDWYSMWRHSHCMNVNKYPERFDLKILHLRSTITSTLRLDTTLESSALCSQENAKYPGNRTFRSLWYRWRLCEAKSWLLTNLKIWSVGKQVVRVGHAKIWSVSHGSIGKGLLYRKKEKHYMHIKQELKSLMCIIPLSLFIITVCVQHLHTRQREPEERQNTPWHAKTTQNAFESVSLASLSKFQNQKKRYVQKIST